MRLAPLYDIASAFGLAGLQPQKMKLAMKIEYYHVDRVLPRHFARWGATAGLDGDQVVARLEALALALPKALAVTADMMRQDGLDHPVIATLERVLTERARKIAAM